MEEKNLFTKLKTIFSKKNKQKVSTSSEFAFSVEELNHLEAENKEKMKELKQGLKKSESKKKEEEIEIEIVEPTTEEESISSNKETPSLKEELILENSPPIENSFINLSRERQEMILKRWNSIDKVQLEKMIMKGKDILAHNYTITYGEDALAYIYKIRNEYDIIIEYLIGFNNEKKGIYNKTIFSDKIDNDWRHLNKYIKILEKIKLFLNK